MPVYRRNGDSRRVGSSSGAVVAIPLVLFQRGLHFSPKMHPSLKVRSWFIAIVIGSCE